MLPFKDLLVKAREKLTPPGTWTQFTFARTPLGGTAVSDHPDACQWCLLGAIFACAPVGAGPELSPFLESLREFDLVPGDPKTHNIAKWNDATGRTQEEVLAMLDSLIAKL